MSVPGNVTYAYAEKAKKEIYALLDSVESLSKQYLFTNGVGEDVMNSIEKNVEFIRGAIYGAQNIPKTSYSEEGVPLAKMFEVQKSFIDSFSLKGFFLIESVPDVVLERHRKSLEDVSNKQGIELPNKDNLDVVFMRRNVKDMVEFRNIFQFAVLTTGRVLAQLQYIVCSEDGIIESYEKDIVFLNEALTSIKNDSGQGYTSLDFF